jgi:hypothetical protein
MIFDWPGSSQKTRECDQGAFLLGMLLGIGPMFLEVAFPDILEFSAPPLKDMLNRGNRVWESLCKVSVGLVGFSLPQNLTSNDIMVLLDPGGDISP